MGFLPGCGDDRGTTRTDHAEPSLFQADGLLRESRRQRRLEAGTVPAVCLLDPDGDVVRHLRRQGSGRQSASWACYHTDLWLTDIGGSPVGIVGCAVGAPFAVLVAEQLFASGCELLLSITSAGQVDPGLDLPCLILIDRAIRGEGTSHAYLPAAFAIEPEPGLLDAVDRGLRAAGLSVRRGGVWTTDAPYRETGSFLDAALAAGALAVEMEAAALYAFAAATGRSVVCCALVTNQMAQAAGDFEKGPADGTDRAIAVAAVVADLWRDNVRKDAT